MQPLTFSCPNCSRRVGVGLELMGKSVRCPNCRQVVVAPTATPSKASFPSPLADPLDDDAALPRFAPPPGEGAESIFGDANGDDSVFEAPDARKPILTPDTDSDDDSSPRSSGVIDFNSKEEPQVLRPMAAEIGIGFGAAIESPGPRVQKDLSQPDFALLAGPEPIVTPQREHRLPRADDVVDPFTKFGRTNATAPAAPRPATTTTAAAPVTTRSRTFWLLAAYAAAVTLIAAWGWLRPTPHPFSAIPDYFGQYHSADRKKVAALPVDVNRPFPDELKVRLGGKILVGDLEFEPLAIEERRTRWEVKAESGRPRDIDCLVLTARVRNRSTRAFHPFDPAFNRYAAPDDPTPLTAVVVAGERYPGGPIPWPFRHTGREFIPGQEADEFPLEPGQERISVIPAIDGDSGKTLVARLRTTSGPALWIVHLRRGFTQYAGESVPVSALVGVEFDASQISSPGKTRSKPS